MIESLATPVRRSPLTVMAAPVPTGKRTFDVVVAAVLLWPFGRGAA